MLITTTSVAEVVKKGLCIGCGVCELSCPLNAIEMVFCKAKGIHHPTIQIDKCTNCGSCLRVCFGVGIDYEVNSSRSICDVFKSTFGKRVQCYLGYAADKGLRFGASSGGAVTALLNYLMDKKLIDGAIVARTEPGNPPLAKAFIARNKDALNSATGSKYCPVLLSDALRLIESGKRYALVGLPCHIYAVKRIVETKSSLKNSIRVYIGLFCGGTPSYNGTRYLLRKYGLEGQSIKRIEYRGGGWPGRMLVQTEHYSLIVPYVEYWPVISPWFHLNRCMVCLSGLNIQADISFGDAWLPELVKNNTVGISIIIARTRMGDRVLRRAKMKGYLEMQPVDNRLFLKTQKSMLRFKHYSLLARLTILNLFRKKYLFKQLVIGGGLSVKPLAYFYEFLLLIGRLLASRVTLWPLFDFYKIALRQIFSLPNRIRRRV